MSHPIDFTAVFETAPHACLLLAPDLSLIGINEAGLRLLGHTREAALGRNINELCAGMQLAISAASLSALSASFVRVGVSRNIETLVLSKADVPVANMANTSVSAAHWQCTHIPILDEQGRLSIIATHLVDMRQRVPEHDVQSMHDALSATPSSHPDDGATIATTTETETEGGRNDGAAVGSLHILFVEDSEDLRDTTAQLLEGLGHTVVAVADAEKALTLLETERFDVLFSDLSLPKMTGAELARETTRRYPGMRIIITSGYGRAMANARGLNAVLLPKPYRLAELAGALNDLQI